ncbi:MAG: hypothetical protein JSS09_08110 [Verrucomicrobia bacterium]|nr:hypothetical protein [Verrucomicrobiota bacterium]
MNLPPWSHSCPFPSFQCKEKLSKFAQENPLQAHQKLINESLLINRIVLAALGSFYAYGLITNYSIYANALLLIGGCLSLPSTLLATSTYFLGQGAYTILSTKEMNQVFQNFFLGGSEIATALTMIYFYDIKPLGILETNLQKTAISYAKQQEASLLN